jgi:hypothetical protein
MAWKAVCWVVWKTQKLWNSFYNEHRNNILTWIKYSCIGWFPSFTVQFKKILFLPTAFIKSIFTRGLSGKKNQWSICSEEQNGIMNMWENLISHTNIFLTTNLSIAHIMRCAVTWRSKPNVITRTAEIRLTITSHKSQEVGNGLAGIPKCVWLKSILYGVQPFPLFS